MTTTSTAKSPTRRAVYSALIGQYETIFARPKPSDPDVDYLFFTDSVVDSAPDGWKKIRVTPRFPTDPVRSARYLKIVGDPVLDKYNETLWVDNRVILRGPVSEVFSHLDGFDFSLPAHSFRTDLTAEFEEVIAAGYDDPKRVRQMFEIARLSGVDRETPLWTGLMLRRRSPAVTECMRAWFELLLLTSRRDQLSINTALNKFPLKTNILRIDNQKSAFHDWVPQTELRRDTSIQLWNRRQKSAALGLSDGLRSTNLGRKFARALSVAGIPVPTLPRQSST